MKNYYQILGITSEAKLSEIKKAYRRLSIKFHPDKNPDDDGYLTSSEAQNDIMARNDPDAFIYLYSLAVNNPSHYSLPRMWRAGLSIQF